MQDRAAFVQIARDGNESADGLLGSGMKLRWMLICVE